MGVIKLREPTLRFDAPEVQNVVLARAIYDPTTYQQIKGRGTRLCPEIKKERFVIHDFAGVIDYFEEKHDWEAPLNAPSGKAGGILPVNLPVGDPPVEGPEGPRPPHPEETPTSQTNDFTLTRNEIRYGLGEGDVVDRNMYQDEWTKAVHAYVNENRAEIERVIDDPEAMDELMDDINQKLLDKPKYHFNEESLRQSHRIIAGVRDFFLAAIGKTALPTRDEQLADFKQGLVNKFADSEGGASQRRTQMVKYLANHLTGERQARERNYHSK